MASTDPDRVHERAVRLLDKVTPRWRDFTDYPEYFELRTVEFILLVVVLEVGCGGGYSSRLWSDVAEEVVGVDLAPEIARARRFLATFPAENIELLEGTGEDLSRVRGPFDLILTQYVLEHVRDVARTLAELRRLLAPGGLAVHVVPNLVDRQEWLLRYRWETNAPRRVLNSLRIRGLARTLRDPLLRYTPAHSPEFGDFPHEFAQYRLERWGLRILRAGFVILDHFQTRDVNWVIVTRAPKTTA